MPVFGWACYGSAFEFLWLWSSVDRGPFSLFHHAVLFWLSLFSVVVHCLVGRPLGLCFFCVIKTAESRAKI